MCTPRYTTDDGWWVTSSNFVPSANTPHHILTKWKDYTSAAYIFEMTTHHVFTPLEWLHTIYWLSGMTTYRVFSLYTIHLLSVFLSDIIFMSCSSKTQKSLLKSLRFPYRWVPFSLSIAHILIEKENDGIVDNNKIFLFAIHLQCTVNCIYKNAVARFL